MIKMNNKIWLTFKENFIQYAAYYTCREVQRGVDVGLGWWGIGGIF